MDVDTAAIAVAAFNDLTVKNDDDELFSSFVVVKRSARVSSSEDNMVKRIKKVREIFYDDAVAFDTKFNNT